MLINNRVRVKTWLLMTIGVWAPPVVINIIVFALSLLFLSMLCRFQSSVYSFVAALSHLSMINYSRVRLRTC